MERRTKEKKEKKLVEMNRIHYNQKKKGGKRKNDWEVGRTKRG
jgi:hypothetical protein